MPPKKRRPPARVAILALAAVLLAGCQARHETTPSQRDGSATPVRGGTLRIVGSADVDHLVSTSAYFTSSMFVMRMVGRTLVTYPPAANYEDSVRLVPDAAIEVPTLANGGVSPDGLVYTFHLRPNLRWDSTPPRPVTASDFVRAFKLFCNPVAPVGAPRYYTSTILGMAEYCDRFARQPATVEGIRRFVETQNLAGVQAPDDATVVFRLTRPASDFLNLLALTFGGAVPVEYLDYLPDSPEFRQHTLSDGPYRIARYQPNREILFERNPVWDPASNPYIPAYVDRIHLRLGIDSELSQLQIEAGTADMTFVDPMLTANLASMLALHDPRVVILPDEAHPASMVFLSINHLSPNEGGALRNLAVRQALALAVDRRALVQLAGGPRMASPLRQAVQSNVTGYRPEHDRYATPDDRGDPEAARRLLARAGYPHGLTLRLVYGNIGTYPIQAQSVQASLRRAGIELQLREYPVSELFGRLLTAKAAAQRGEWDLAVTAWFPDWNGANNGRSVIQPLYDGRNLDAVTQNFGRYRNARVDAAIDRALAAPTVDSAEAAWAEAVAVVTDDVAVVPLIEKKQAFIFSSRVRNCGYFVLALDCDATAMWLSDPHDRRVGSTP